MKLLIVAVGQRVPDWAQTAWDDYAKRFPPELKVELKAVKTEPRGSKTLETLYAAERQRIVDQAIAAHFVARKRLAVSQHYIQPCPGQCQRAGRTRRARPDHQHVTLLRNRIVLTAHQARRDDA